MTKLNYSNYEDKNAKDSLSMNHREVLQENQVEMMPEQTHYDLSESKEDDDSGQFSEVAADPVEDICKCIEKVLNTIEFMGKCVTVVSIEKQRTKQIENEAKIQISESQEQTERIRIHEEEETKRLKIKCKNELQKQKTELEKLRSELKSKEISTILSHKEYMVRTNILHEALCEIMKTKDEVFQMLKECDEENVEMYLHKLQIADEQLVDIVKQVSNMKGV